MEKGYKEIINENIKKQDKQISKNLLIIYDTINLCEQFTKSQKRRLLNLLKQLTQTKLSKKEKVAKVIENILEKNKDNLSYIDEKKVRENLKQKTWLTFSEKNDILYQICYKNPADVIQKHIRDYILNCNILERYNDDLKKSTKQYSDFSDKKSTSKEESMKKSESIIYRDKFNEKIVRDSKTKFQEKSSAEYDSALKMQTYLEKKYEKLIKDSSDSTVKLEDDDKSLIYELFEKLPNPHVYVTEAEKILENSFNIRKTIFSFTKSNSMLSKNNNKPTLNKLLDIALITITELPNELVKTYTFYEQNLLSGYLNRNIGAVYYLEQYKEAYDQFTKYYNNLSKEEKEKLEANFNNSNVEKYRRLGIENFEILTPERLKILVNNSVISKLSNEHNTFVSNDFGKVQSILKKATMFMDNQSISRCYQAILKSYNQYNIYKNADETKRNIYDKQTKNLQYNFVMVISEKINEKEKEGKNKKELINYICKTYLYEEPLFDISLDEADLNIPIEKTERKHSL